MRMVERTLTRACADRAEPLPWRGRRQRIDPSHSCTAPERTMKSRSALFIALLLVAAMAGTASAKVRNVTDPDAPRSLPEQGPVSVRWEDPAQFTEIRYSHNAVESRRGNWVEQLATHLRERAQKRLPPGQRLDVNITNIDRAGDYEPWRGIQFQDVRFMRDLYPPRMTLTFRRTNADGSVIAEGERKLSDSGFLMSSNSAGSGSDPLRFEKSLIDRWLSRELASPSS
jgi:hypothetical protein